MKRTNAKSVFYITLLWQKNICNFKIVYTEYIIYQNLNNYPHPKIYEI